MSYVGDFPINAVINSKFTTVDTAGAPTAFTATPILAVYKDNSTTESQSGLTVTTNFDSRTGMHNIQLDLSQNTSFYSSGSDFDVVILAGTISTTSLTGYVPFSFSVEHRSALRPTTAGRTLDVSSGGEAGLDWNNIGSPTTTQNLSGTSVKTATDVETDTQDIQGRLPTSLFAGRMNSYIGDTASGLTVNITGNISGSIGSLGAQAKLDVNAEVVDTLNVDTYAEPGQEAPAATNTLVKKIGYLYKAFRNKITQDATTLKLFADDGSTVDQKATVSDSGTEYTRGEIGTGP